MSVKLPTEQHLEFLSLKGGCSGSSESTHFKMPHCWKSYVVAQLFINLAPILCDTSDHVVLHCLLTECTFKI